MKCYSVQGNTVKLDGGAMFGNVPKALWQKWFPPDEENRITLTGRGLLVQTENHLILFETGIGAFMKREHRDRYGVQEDRHVLLESLSNLGFSHEDVTWVILSHLHFDHAGGLLSTWEEGKEQELLFPNASIVTGEKNWKRALAPHFRDRASFSPEITEKLKASKRLNVVSGKDKLLFDDLRIDLIESDGHSPGMICSHLNWKEGNLFFPGDLIPGTAWVHLPVTMGYDRYPEKLIEEKKELLESAVASNAWIFFTHDPKTALGRVAYNEEKKRFLVKETHEDCSSI